MKSGSLIAFMLLAGCAGVNKPRITGVALVGGSQMNNDNFFGNFYEREEIFNRMPGLSFRDLTQQHLDGKQPPGIGIKIKGEF